jgi:YopX protein
MRDIKFRAWEAANGQMNYDPRFIAWESAAGMPLYAINRANQEPDVVLMEYTGLKDKNGKDIYEGDILKGGNGGLVQCEDALRVFYSSAEAARQLEVVGNIYENPELLKK